MRAGMPITTARLERGVSLPIVLMFLLVITILGTIGMRRATTGETLSRNQLDYEVARQATEAALRDAERDLKLAGPLRPNALCARDDDRPIKEKTMGPYFDPSCPRGQCRNPLDYYYTSNYTTVTNPEPWWPTINGKKGLWEGPPATPSAKPSDAAGAGTNCTFTGAVPLGTFTGVARFAGVARQPEYLMEYFKGSAGDDIVIRISARGFGADINTEVVMQTYYRPFLPSN